MADEAMLYCAGRLVRNIMPTAELSKPKILCLHAAGSSEAIFKVQGRRIFPSLRNEFSCEFVDAPFASKPGPGMGPFEDSGPFWRWQCDLSATVGFDISEAEVADERDQTREKILDKLRAMGSNVVGIIALSQGARVATGLLLYLEKMRQEGRLQELKLPEIRFAVINSSTYPPLYLDQETEDWVNSGPEQKRKVSIPSLHLYGSTDPWRPESETMKAGFYAEASAEVMEFTGGHQMPLEPKDTGKVIKKIRDLSQERIE
jgi:predicted esterase